METIQNFRGRNVKVMKFRGAREKELAVELVDQSNVAHVSSRSIHREPEIETRIPKGATDFDVVHHCHFQRTVLLSLTSLRLSPPSGFSHPPRSRYSQRS